MTKYFLCLFLCAAGQRALGFDHNYSAYASVLSRFVNDGVVDYASLKDSADSLNAFLAETSELSFDEYHSWRRETQLAFLINLYNAAALQIICKHYPVQSIRDIGGFFSSPWNEKFIHLFDHDVSLGQIMHDILRPEFHEPRIHFAVVNASKACPKLRSVPYRTEVLEEQLRTAANDYMKNRETLNHVSGGVLWLSPLFDWYSDDFGGQSGMRVFAQNYFPQIENDTEIRFSGYDWSLNGK